MNGCFTVFPLLSVYLQLVQTSNGPGGLCTCYHNQSVRGTAWYSLATRGLVMGGGVGGGVGRIVHCNSYRMVNMTAPNSKKQKKVEMKYPAKILWESSL